MSLFDSQTGYIKLRPKQGEKRKYQKKNIDAKNKLKEICLNCKRKKCRGCISRESTFTIKAATESTQNVQDDVELTNVDTSLPIEESVSESENASNNA